MDDMLWMAVVAVGAAVFFAIVFSSRKKKPARPVIAQKAPADSYEKAPQASEADKPEAKPEPEGPGVGLVEEGRGKPEEPASEQLRGRQSVQVNPKISTKALVHFEEATSGIRIMESVRRLEQTLPFPLRCFARRIDDGLWHPVAENAAYDVFLAVADLATSGYAIDELAASRFIAEMNQMAIRFETEAETEEADDILVRATALKKAIDTFDMELVFVLQTPGIIPKRDFSEAVARTGFVEVAKGALYRYGVEGAFPFVTLRREENTLGSVRLALDAACARTELNPFGLFLSLANDLAARLKLAITDTANRELTMQSVHVIEEQLARFYAGMRRAGLEPGSEDVLRVLRRR